MALETGTYISDLVITNPTSTDAKSEGDNHFRLIKSTLKATFPNVTGAVTKTQTQLNNMLDKTGDSITGTVLYTGSVGMGYGTGSGGTVTQATSKSTAVTLNKPSGLITMNNAALAAGATVTMQLNNTIIEANDLILVQPDGGGAGNEYQAWISLVSAGSCLINVRNNSAGSRSDALQVQFAVLKVATS